MSKHFEQEAPPCQHMEQMLQMAADGRIRGLRRWYVLAHAASCGQCGRFLQRMRETIAQLRKSQPNSPDETTMERLKQGKWRDELNQ